MEKFQRSTARADARLRADLNPPCSVVSAIICAAKIAVKGIDDIAGRLALDAIPDCLPIPARGDNPVAPKKGQMLRNRRVANAKEFCELADGVLSIRKTAKD